MHTAIKSLAGLAEKFAGIVNACTSHVQTLNVMAQNIPCLYFDLVAGVRI